MIPKFIFLTKGTGTHKERLASFELALRSAGIHRCNIVNVSSIIPPRCKLISKEEGLKMLQPGEITFAVLSKNSVKEPTLPAGSTPGDGLADDQSPRSGI